MSSLSSALNTAVQSLGADTGALQVTNNNIANANTPGYTRQVAVFQEAAPTEEGNFSVGNGVVLEGYQSVRDRAGNVADPAGNPGPEQCQCPTEHRCSRYSPPSPPRPQDIGTQMSALFASLSSLSTRPDQLRFTPGSARSRAESGHRLSTQLPTP